MQNYEAQAKHKFLSFSIPFHCLVPPALREGHLWLSRFPDFSSFNAFEFYGIWFTIPKAFSGSFIIRIERTIQSLFFEPRTFRHKVNDSSTLFFMLVW